jgi:hypothetical protein
VGQFKGPRIHTGENSQILTVSKKKSYLNLRAPKKFCMQLSKVFFFTQRICTVASLEWQFPSRKKTITLGTHLLYK